MGDDKIHEKNEIGCSCGIVLREVAAENLQFRIEVEALKEERKKMKALIRFRDRKEHMFLLVLAVCVLYGWFAMFLRG